MTGWRGVVVGCGWKWYNTCVAVERRTVMQAKKRGEKSAGEKSEKVQEDVNTP